MSSGTSAGTETSSRSPDWKIALQGLTLLAAFLTSHVVLFALTLRWAPEAASDLVLYSSWVSGSEAAGQLGVTAPWVYPVGAWLPIWLAAIFGTGPVYAATWCSMVAAINLAVSALTIKSVGLSRAVWPLTGWFVFLALLGTPGIARLDAVMMPMVMAALLVWAARPVLASVLVTASAWIKVAGGVTIIPLFLTQKNWREGLRQVVLPAAIVCLVICLLQRLAGGEWTYLTSFIAEEADRGLQVEAVLATPVVLGHLLKKEVLWQYNWDLATVETWGPGADAAMVVSNITMPIMVVGVSVLIWLARRYRTDAMLLGTLTLLTGLICTHKVGSPQFVAWTAPAVVVALALRRRLKFWIPIGAILLVTAGLTGLIFPWGYVRMLGGSYPWLAAWVVRNGLLVAVMVCGIVQLVRLARQSLIDRWAGADPLAVAGPPGSTAG